MPSASMPTTGTMDAPGVCRARLFIMRDRPESEVLAVTILASRHLSVRLRTDRGFGDRRCMARVVCRGENGPASVLSGPELA
jgi:hypothetical protein